MKACSVLVAAPTGSGKTLVAEHADCEQRPPAKGRKAFYTTPDQGALQPEVRRPGHRASTDQRQVGLLTGDNVVNPDAAADRDDH